MEFRVIAKSARTITLELISQTAYQANEPYTVYVNDTCVIEEGNKNVFTLYKLEPNTSYTVAVQNINTEEKSEQTIQTENEYIRLDVKRFGAVGDGMTEDTMALQAAILACPDNGCVYVSKGTYLTGPLFLRSNMTLELDEKATLVGITDRTKYPILPGYTVTTDEQEEYYLGTWEGNPLDMMASLITGINVENVKIIGLGTLDGNAQNGDWWLEPKKRNRACRQIGRAHV